MRAPYMNLERFRFSVYRKTVFSGIGKLFGMQDIEIGDPPFDDSFIVKATDEIDLFAETLDRLTRMGAADPGPANVQLK